MAETTAEDGVFGAYYFFNYDLESDEKEVTVAIYGDMKSSSSLPSHGSAMLQTIAQ